MLIDLRGKVAVVTGVSRGIGRAIAETFGQEGVGTVGLDIEPNGLETLASEFRERGHAGEMLVCDVRNASEVDSTITAVAEKYGRIDILVNNAGVALTGTVEHQSEADWSAVIDSNLTGTFLMCKAVAPIMKRQRCGRILNASSFGAIVPALNSAAYAASKGGVILFSRVLAGELGPWDITVNSYAPGMIPTDMNHFTEQPPEVQTRLLNTLTLRRWGEKKYVCSLLCFLASDLAANITGALIDVSGGKLATQTPWVAYERAAAAGEIDWMPE